MTNNIRTGPSGTDDRKVEVFGPAITRVPRKRGGGKLKEIVVRDARTRSVLRYSLAYINPISFAGDNGRILGYDNAHGRRHRHFLGVETAMPDMAYEDLAALFERQWRALARQVVDGEDLRIDP